MTSKYFLSSVKTHKTVPHSSYSVPPQYNNRWFYIQKNWQLHVFAISLDSRNKMWTDIPFKFKTALTPETKMCFITEQKCAERLHLYNIFIRSVITNIQVVLQTSSKQKTSIIRINLV